MRFTVAIIAVWLCIGLAWAAEPPELIIEGVSTRQWSLPELADWSSPRYFSGIGWELGTAAREGGPVMRGGYTVIQDTKAGPVTLRHCFVLAAFDLIPARHLLVCIRDPQHYWPRYDISQGVTDPIDLVWYDDKWEEIVYITLDYSSMERPDEFVLNPSDTALVAINKALMDEGRLDPGGHWLNLISLRDGTITDILLPEADSIGNLPSSWLPLLMHFDSEGHLQVQAGDEMRVYKLKWD